MISIALLLSQNILIYNFIIVVFDCQGEGISAKAFALARPGATPSLLATHYFSSSISQEINLVLTCKIRVSVKAKMAV